MRTFLFLSFLLFFACKPETPDPQAEETTVQAPAITSDPVPAVAESGEPLAAGQVAALPEMYVSYDLYTAFGAKFTSGVVRVHTSAFTAVPAGQVYDPFLLLKDLIRKLQSDGVLRGIDLTQKKANWLLIKFPGATPPARLEGDSRKM